MPPTRQLSKTSATFSEQSTSSQVQSLSLPSSKPPPSAVSASERSSVKAKQPVANTHRTRGKTDKSPTLPAVPDADISPPPLNLKLSLTPNTLSNINIVSNRSGNMSAQKNDVDESAPGASLSSSVASTSQASTNLSTSGDFSFLASSADSSQLGSGYNAFPVVASGMEATGRWTKAEHILFLEALKMYGKEWRKVASHVKTRTVVQTRTHAQKYFQKVMKTAGGGADGEGSDVIGMGIETGEVMLMMGKDPTTTSNKKKKKSISSKKSASSAAADAAAKILQHQNTSLHQQSLLDSNPYAQMDEYGSMMRPGFHANDTMAADFLKGMSSSMCSSMGSSNPPQDHAGTDRFGRTSLPPDYSERRHMSIIAPAPVNHLNSHSQQSVMPSSTNRHMQSPESNTSFFPTPSPAACGKRKHAELTAATMLATVRGNGVPGDVDSKKSLVMKGVGEEDLSSAMNYESAGATTNIEDYFQNRSQGDQNDGSSLFFQTPISSPKGKKVKGHASQPQKVVGGEVIYPISSLSSKKTLRLQIVNPENFKSQQASKGTPSPSTPWESQIKSLESFSGDFDFTDMDINFDEADVPVLDAAPSSTSATTDSVKSPAEVDKANVSERPTPPPVEEKPPAQVLNPNMSKPKKFLGDKLQVNKSISQGTVKHPHPLDMCRGRTHLHQLCLKGSVKEIMRYLEKMKKNEDNKDVNVKDENKFTPLHSAACLDVSRVGEGVAANIVKGLISIGASVSEKDATGSTALHWAARAGNGDVVHLLTAHHSPINAVNKDNETALHWGMRTGVRGLNSVRVLVEDGAKTSIYNKSFKRALDVAAEGFAQNDSPLSPPSRTATTEKLPSVSEREKSRMNLLGCEPRLRTLILHHPECLEHLPRSASDWECPDRVKAILNKIGSGERFGAHEVTVTSEFERASLEVLARCHSTDYIQFVNELSLSLEKDSKGGAGSGPVVPFTPAVQKKNNASTPKNSVHSDTSFSAGSLKAARRAAGSVKHAVDRVLLGRNKNAFCVVRPPGHHAGIGGLLDGAESCGFCIFNNVAAGALYALSKHHSSRCQKVAIIDLDVHHGNGTEEVVRNFTEAHRLFFFSAHLYDEEPRTNYTFYPGSGGEDDMAHNIINVPIAPLWRSKDIGKTANWGEVHKHNTRGGGHREAEETESGTESESGSQVDSGGKKVPQHYMLGTGREAFKVAIESRLLPSLRAFNPDLILISSGFDGNNKDVGNAKHLAARERVGIDLSPSDFRWATSKICEIADICCNGRVISVLEGGYGSTKRKETRASSTGGTSDDGEEAEKERQEAINKITNESLDRAAFAECACEHLRALVDPYHKN